VDPWQQIAGAIVLVLTALGAGLKWLLAWMFRTLETRDERFLTGLSELRKNFRETLTEKDQRIDTEREARLQDRQEHAETLRQLSEKFADAMRTRSQKPPSTQ